MDYAAGGDVRPALDTISNASSMSSMGPLESAPPSSYHVVPSQHYGSASLDWATQLQRPAILLEPHAHTSPSFYDVADASNSHYGSFGSHSTCPSLADNITTTTSANSPQSPPSPFNSMSSSPSYLRSKHFANDTPGWESSNGTPSGMQHFDTQPYSPTPLPANYVGAVNGYEAGPDAQDAHIPLSAPALSTIGYFEAQPYHAFLPPTQPFAPACEAPFLPQIYRASISDVTWQPTPAWPDYSPLNAPDISSGLYSSALPYFAPPHSEAIQHAEHIAGPDPTVQTPSNLPSNSFMISPAPVTKKQRKPSKVQKSTSPLIRKRTLRSSTRLAKKVRPSYDEIESSDNKTHEVAEEVITGKDSKEEQELPSAAEEKKWVAPKSLQITKAALDEQNEMVSAWREKGISYKKIKEMGNLTESESTLRGRNRAFKRGKLGVMRKPDWSQKDVERLNDIVDGFIAQIRADKQDKLNKGNRIVRHFQVPWSKVAKAVETEAEYPYGPSSCADKWFEMHRGHHDVVRGKCASVRRNWEAPHGAHILD